MNEGVLISDESSKYKQIELKFESILILHAEI